MSLNIFKCNKVLQHNNIVKQFVIIFSIRSRFQSRQGRGAAPKHEVWFFYRQDVRGARLLHQQQRRKRDGHVGRALNDDDVGHRDDTVATDALRLLPKLPTRVSLLFTGKCFQNDTRLASLRDVYKSSLNPLIILQYQLKSVKTSQPQQSRQQGWRSCNKCLLPKVPTRISLFFTGKMVSIFHKISEFKSCIQILA